MTNESSEFISIHTVANRFEADLLLGALQQEEIPAILRSFEETAYDGLFVSQRGWGQILVPETLASRAVEVIQPLIGDLEGKALYVDPSKVDPSLWESLQEAAPDTVCLNAMVRRDKTRSGYVVPLLNAEFLCRPETRTIDMLTPSPYYKLDFMFYLVLLHYLLEARPGALSGKWVSEQDIPGGQLFFRGQHGFPVEPLIELFGTRPELFASASERLDGVRVDMGDVAYRFWALPRIPMLLILWKGDDEFAPALNIRFDATISRQLQNLDSIWALVHVVCRTLRSTGKRILAETGR